jgi:hypothetical protein
MRVRSRHKPEAALIGWCDASARLRCRSGRERALAWMGLAPLLPLVSTTTTTYCSSLPKSPRIQFTSEYSVIVSISMRLQYNIATGGVTRENGSSVTGSPTEWVYLLDSFSIERRTWEIAC